MKCRSKFFIFNVAILSSITSCDKTKDLGLQEKEPEAATAYNYKEIPSAGFETDYGLRLSWPMANLPVSDKLTFDIYEHVLGENEVPTGEIVESANAEKQQFRDVKVRKITVSPETSGPAKRGRLLTSLAAKSDSFTIDSKLKLDRIYTYEIVAKVDGVAINGERYLVSVDKLKPETLFKGCHTLNPVDKGSIKVEFDYPKGAKDVSVFRGGVKVFNTQQEQVNSFIDKNLDEATQYKYNCAAKIGPVEIYSDGSVVATTDKKGKISTNPKIAAIYKKIDRKVTGYIDEVNIGDEPIVNNDEPKNSEENPLDTLTNYTGCIATTVLGTSSVKIDYQFPNEAEEASIYRNGIHVFTTDDKTLTSFVDSGLNAGITYHYSCRLQNKGKVLKGSANTAATTSATPDPIAAPSNPLATISNYVGCSATTVLGTSTVKIDYQFPTEAEEASVYRNGINVFTTDNKSLTSFVDSGLNAGITYYYTCRIKKDNFERKGSANLAATTDAVAPVVQPNNPLNAITSYAGCTSAVAQGTSTIKIDYEFPNEATEASVYRNGINIFNTTDKSLTTFVDSGLNPGITYYYNCRIQKNGFSRQGTANLAETTQSIAPSPTNPLDAIANYTGCTTASTLGTTTIKVDFQFPTEAEETSIYRNGINIYNSSDKSLLSFTDSGLNPNITYYYNCRIHKNGFTRKGSTNLAATTQATPTVVEPTNPLSALTNYDVGCTATTVLGASSIKIDYQFPPEAAEASVYRNGIQIFSTENKSLTSFVDSGLNAGITYYYDCRIHKDGFTRKGSANLSAKTANGEDTGTNPLLDIVGYNGCKNTSTALNTSQIKIDFEFPAGAESASVYRNGIVIFSTENNAFTSFTDTGLVEGTSYLYTCKIHKGKYSLLGSNNYTIQTLIANPPVFAGIKNAEVVGNQVKVSWLSPASTGVPAKDFKIYGKVLSGANDTSELDWNTPLKTVLFSSDSFVMFNDNELGDNLYYKFAVRSCSASGACDENVVTKVLFIPNNGAPIVSTIGVNVINSKLVVTAPWTHVQGELTTRKVYWKKDAGTFALAQEFSVTNTIQPPQSLVINTPLMEGSNYQVYLVDVDANNNNSANSNIENITISDITPPAFSGLSDVVFGTPADTAIKLQFTTPAADQSVSTYSLYLKTLAGNESGNACTGGAIFTSFAASGFTASTSITDYQISGLQPRTRYSVCLRATDANGNVSTNSTAIEITTKDITAPLFNGLNSLQFENQDRKIILGWEATPSSDVKEYKVEIWSGDQNTGYASRTAVLVPHNSTTSTGATITNTQFAVAENTVYWVLVNACDNASPDFGAQNCSAYAAAHSYSFATTDLTPPPGFSGITAVNQTVQGTAVVSWNAPANWSDYRGFKVYDVVDNNLVLLKTCACTAVGCPDAITSCSVDVGIRRTYNFYVSAYDAVGNQALKLPYTNNDITHIAIDTTPPTFSGDISLGGAPLFPVSWNAATDTQYDTGTKITYVVYRKKSADFLDLDNPAAEIGNANVTVFPITESLFSNDLNSMSEGSTYYYTVCAKDHSANQKCLGYSKPKLINDITKPILGLFASNKVDGVTEWTMRWVVTDNYTSMANLAFKLYRTTTDTAQNPELIEANLISNGTGYSLACTTICQVGDQRGPVGQVKFVNYKLVVTDEAGNVTESSTVSVQTDGALLEITSAVRTEGPTAGGTLVQVYGNGFQDGAVVSMGNINCARTDFISSKRLLCLTAAATAGVYLVNVRNPSGATNQIPVVTFEYKDTGHVCNQPSLRAASFAGGDGTISDPYKICTLAQLQTIKNSLTSHYVLEDNIDMFNLANWWTHSIGTGTTAGTAAFSASFKGSTNGDGTPKYMIAHMKLTAAAGEIGFFRFVSGATIRDLEFYKGVVHAGTNNSWDNIGTLVGWSSSLVAVNITVLNGTVNNGRNNIGGIIGYAQSNSTFDRLKFIDGSVSAPSAGAYSGGQRVGGLIGHTSVMATGMELKNSYSTGNLTGVHYVGGLAGWINVGDYVDVDNIANDNYSTMTINAFDYVGGLFGRNDAYNILTSHYNGTITGRSYVGGLVGQMIKQRSGGGANYRYVSKSDSKGQINGLSAGIYVGGLFGSIESGQYASTLGVLESFSTMNINSNGTYVGGFAGHANYTTFDNCYYSGNVYGQNYVGGLLGYHSTEVYIRRSYMSGNSSALLTNLGALVAHVTGSANRRIQNVFWLGTGTLATSYSSLNTVEIYANSGSKTLVELQNASMADYTTGSFIWNTTTVWLFEANKLPKLRANPE